MNYKIAKTMLVLCGIYLIAFYILKFFFPEMLLQVITSPTLLRLGEVISTWKGFEVIFNLIGTFITLYLFASASSGNLKKSVKEIFIIVIGVVLTALIYYFATSLYTHSVTAIMFIVAWICKGNLKYATISFTIHGYLSQFLLSIRGFETILVKITDNIFLGGYVLSPEMYVWLILLSLLFHFKEKEKNGNALPSVSQ